MCQTLKPIFLAEISPDWQSCRTRAGVQPIIFAASLTEIGLLMRLF